MDDTIDDVVCQLSTVDASLNECFTLIQNGDMENPYEIIKVIIIFSVGNLVCF